MEGLSSTGTQTKRAKMQHQLLEFKEAADELQASKMKLDTQDPNEVQVQSGIDQLLDAYEKLQDAQSDLFSCALDSLTRKLTYLEYALQQISGKNLAV